MKERGTVKEIRDKLVTVQLEETEGCAGCHNDGCKSKRQAIQAWNGDGVPISEGDEIEVEVSGKAQLEGALWILGLPLLLFVVGYLAVRALTPGASELPAAMGGLGGLAMGMVIGVSVQKSKKFESLARVLRVVLAGAEAGDGGGIGAEASEGEENSFDKQQG